jgi:hypothetical protein
MLSQEDAIREINRLCQPDELIAITSTEGFVFMSQHIKSSGFRLQTFLMLSDAEVLVNSLIQAFPHIKSINNLYRNAPILDPEQGPSLFYPLALACIFWSKYGIAELKKWISLTFVRYLGGDLNLIEEITRKPRLVHGIRDCVYHHERCKRSVLW